MDATLPRLAINGASRLAQHMWSTDFSARRRGGGARTGKRRRNKRRNKGEIRENKPKPPSVRRSYAGACACDVLSADRRAQMILFPPALDLGSEDVRQFTRLLALLEIPLDPRLKAAINVEAHNLPI